MGALTEKPILFSGTMVEAILSGRKTQTRRLVRWPDWVSNHERSAYELNTQPGIAYYVDGVARKRFMRRYNPGDTLWVRETFANMSYDCDPSGPNWTYRAGAPSTDVEGWALPPGVKWKPGIHMPRVAARITLRVESVRVERVQSISREDEVAEGTPDGMFFDALWDSINEKRAPWSSNPWVWVVSFTRVSPV